MSSLVGALTGGGNNAGFQAQNANVTAATPEQMQQQYQNAQNALAQQQSFANAVNANNGLATQQNVINQLGNVAAGQGPNPAQSMLAQQTAANTANQAALMAGQRNSGANAGLMARQIAQQGAANQQNAIGQGATMQANQQLGALGQMGSLAGQQAAQAQSANNALNQAAQGEQGALNAQNNTAVSNASQMNQANEAIAAQNAKGQSNLLGAVMGGIGTAFGGPLGGMIGSGLSGLFQGGGGGGATPAASAGPSPMDQNGMATAAASGASPMDMNGIATANGLQGYASGGEVHKGPQSRAGKHFHALANGGTVPVLLSPGEKVLSPEQAQLVAKSGANPMAIGKTVPGKPKVGGAKNDYANDTFKTELKPGSVVVPRSETKAKDADRKSIEFVQATLAKKRHSKAK